MLILLLSTVGLIPLILFFINLYRFFPKNTVRLPVPLLLPISLVLTLFIHIPTMIIVFFSLPDYCFDFTHGPNLLFEEIRTSWTSCATLIFLIWWFCYFPWKIFFYSVRALKNAWIINKKLRKRYPEQQELEYGSLANFVENVILHPIAVLASYNDKIEEIMVDVRTSDGFLFSGKLSKYFCNGHDHIGISQTNILKFDLRSSEKSPSIYLVPNNGEMYFPDEKILDLHFWKLKKGTHAKIEITNKDSAARFAWLCSMQTSFPHLEIGITAMKPIDLEVSVRKEMVSQLGKCGLAPKDVKVIFKNISN